MRRGFYEGERRVFARTRQVKPDPVRDPEAVAFAKDHQAGQKRDRDGSVPSLQGRTRGYIAESQPNLKVHLEAEHPKSLLRAIENKVGFEIVQGVAYEVFHPKG